MRLSDSMAVLRPPKDLTRPGLKRRILHQIEDEETTKEETRPEGTPLTQPEQIESIKEEPRGSEILQVNSFTEVNEVIKMEPHDASASPPTRIVPYHDLEKYKTISMPVL